MPNRLAREKSPYLLQHAENPVDWFPWGEEAFAKAREEGKPIFLSIGYSTCHWCHVMAHESFENPAIAKIMNEHFVCIKLDREERPDVDKVYMTFVQATTGGGGWPMSVWLTPGLKPFFGGTYFPPEDRHGRPGFPTVLLRVAEVWTKDRARVEEQGEQTAGSLRDFAAAEPAGGALPGREALRACYGQFSRSFDEEDGGFGRAPKFPRPAALNFLLRFHDLEGEKRALDMALFTLRKMAEGGMHDHLGGGFHRYSVDRFWHIPHFEKMLYDQAQLALAYLDAFQITCEPFYEYVARDILDYVRRDMTDAGGGFYSAEDADSLVEHGKTEHSEGAFYVWTKKEIDDALGADAEVFNRVYGVEEQGNAPQGSDPQGEFEGKNTLIRRMTDSEAARFFKKDEAEIAASLAGSRQKLFELRARRPRPHLDDKIITAWNGLMISAFARAYEILDDDSYLAAAMTAAHFLRSHLVRDGGLLRSYRDGSGEVPGVADDYAFLIQGLLDLYEASAQIEWLQWALDLQQRQDALFADAQNGGWFSARGDDPHILIRMKEDYDGAEPSPNSVGALNLLRLAAMTGDDSFRVRAEKAIAAFSAQLQRVPVAMPQMLSSLIFSLAHPKQIVIAGKPGAADTRALLREVRAHFIPGKIVLHADGAEGQAFLAIKNEFMGSIAPIGGKAAAYVCEKFTCRLPVADPARLRELLAKTQGDGV
ncbi:MAG TPA: thioredoxin domain-containing protein [Chthoniobacteraceae bacterium]|nr:thioredoxin domain-containing protein [Chthoniobacteraceae bacterium]